MGGGGGGLGATNKDDHDRNILMTVIYMHKLELLRHMRVLLP